MIEKKYKGERLLEIDNLHVSGCNSPPSIDAAGKYLGYFENAYGEQWVFIGDHKTGTAALRGGDKAWPSQHILSRDEPYPSGLILNDAEKQWIIACFMAMSHATYGAVAADFKAGDPMATTAELLKGLTEGQATELLKGLTKGQTVDPLDEQNANGGKDDSRKDREPGE